MGLKNGEDILKQLRKMAPGAFTSAVQVKDGQVFKTVAVDLMSVAHSMANGCRTGAELLVRLRNMLTQHYELSHAGVDDPNTVETVSIFCIDDYAQTPPTKEIERDKRAESTGDIGYKQEVKLCEPVKRFVGRQNRHGEPADDDESGEEVFETSCEVPIAIYRYALETPLPDDFSRVRATPTLMRKFLRFICELIAKEHRMLVNNRPRHVIVVDGFRDYTALRSTDNENDRTSAASKHVGVWRSDIVDGPKFAPRPSFTPGEGEIKAVFRAVASLAEGNAVVHANDGDILPLLALNAARGPTEHRVVGAMSTSYLMPIEKNPRADATADENAKPKVFDPMALIEGIWNATSAEMASAGLPTRPDALPGILPQTYVYFLMMCGNDSVDTVPGFGPAKVFKALTSRRRGLLDTAVVLSDDGERINVQVDERAILDTLIGAHSALLAKSTTPEFLAAWLRRIAWTIDYNINCVAGRPFLDPLAVGPDGLSLHGYCVGDGGRCKVQNAVHNPTIVALVPASARPPKTKLPVEFDADKVLAKKAKSMTAIDTQAQAQAQPQPQAQAPTPLARTLSFEHVLLKTFRSTPRTEQAQLVRKPVPFGETFDENAIEPIED